MTFPLFVRQYKYVVHVRWWTTWKKAPVHAPPRRPGPEPRNQDACACASGASLPVS